MNTASIYSVNKITISRNRRRDFNVRNRNFLKPLTTLIPALFGLARINMLKSVTSETNRTSRFQLVVLLICLKYLKGKIYCSHAIYRASRPPELECRQYLILDISREKIKLLISLFIFLTFCIHVFFLFNL